MSIRTVVVAVVGVSGKENVKGRQGVGKSVLCNRFVRGDYDDFIVEHSSVLSQTDFSGSPVINNDHWLYWGDRSIDNEDLGSQINIRVIEQTEFLDDETFEPLAGPSNREVYAKRAARVKLESKDKLMYLQKEQLGLEVEFPQQILPDGKCNVDCFVYVLDVANVPGRSFESQVVTAIGILTNVVKTKKPFVIAISKCDAADEDWNKALQQLTNNKHLKGVHFVIIETSSFLNVNVEETFISAVLLAVKGKCRTKSLTFSEAAKVVNDRCLEIRQAYMRLLQSALPIENWPMQRLSFASLLLKLGVDRHKDYQAFIRRNGTAAAKKLYDQHVNEAREYWMGARLRALLPKLPHVFAALLDSQEVPRMSWSDAKRLIHSHAFFEEYFQPLGVLGRQLDPLTPENQYEEKRPDPRIPAEILLRSEARDCYETYKAALDSEQRQERLEEEFEYLLADTKQVTPGRTLQDVSIFLQGCEAYEALAPAQAAKVYDRFQADLVQRAEAEFDECLLEYIELFIEVIITHRDGSLPRGVYLQEKDMYYLKDFLQEDHRYRQLSRLFELRDNMIHQLASFVATPMISRCHAKKRCADVVTPEVALLFLQRRRSIEPAGIVDILIHGEISVVAAFITELHVMLRNEIFLSSSGPATIRCFSSDEYLPEEGVSSKTQLFLIDSPAALERAKFTVEHSLRDDPDAFSRFPPMYVLVCDPSHYDLLPQLHQQGTMLADATGGVFVGAGSDPSEGSEWSKNSDCSSIFGKDQLARVCEAASNSSLNSNKSDLRVKVSIMCGDPFPIEVFLGAILANEGPIFTSAKYNDILGGGTIPLTILLPSDSRCRVDLSISSYHNWIFSKHLHGRNGHILLYSAKRAASLAHAKAAVSRILDNGSYSVSGKSIFLIAIVDKTERFDEECSNLLLTEGSELAQSIGAAFAVLSSDSADNRETTEAFVHYFDRLMYIAPQYPTSTTTSSRDQLKSDNDGYATLTEIRNMHLSPAGFPKNPSEHSSESTNSTASTGQLYVAKKPGSENAVMKNSVSTNSVGASASSMGGRPRRRIAPAAPQVRIPVFRSPMMAPLATPEAIDVAAEYSLVQDALTDDDHIYATLDFEKEYVETSGSAERNRKEKKKPLRERMFSAYSTNPSSSKETAREKKSSTTSAPLMSLSATAADSSYRTPALLRSSNFRPSTQTQPIAKDTSNYDAITRSVTTEFSRDGVKHRRPLLVPPMEPGLRHSLSAESIVDLMHEKKKQRHNYSAGATKFVRKVATSFRIKKSPGHNGKIEDDDGNDHKFLGVEPVTESRSLPQSPQVEKRQMKKIGSNSEKTSSFSWLPSRSPRRNSKQVAQESSQGGVISPTDTLESLCIAGGNLPVFLQKCVEFIEKDGLALEGLYRVPGNQAQLAELEKVFREKGDANFEAMGMPVHVVATAVKNFFSRLPEPVIPEGLQLRIISVLDENDTAEKLRVVFTDLDRSNTDVLRFFLGHLHKVAESPATAMDIKNLSKVFFPTFFRPNFTDFAAMSSGMEQYEKAMEAVILHSVHIFSSLV